MKCLRFIGLMLLCFILKIKAQNLVPNPDFESHTNCTNIYLANAAPWCLSSSGSGSSSYYNPCYSDQLHTTPTQTFNACFHSHQIPRSGVGYIDIGSYVMSSTQENIVPQVKLIDTLETGKIYCVTYYVSVWNNAKYTIDKLGALLTPTPFPCFVASGPTVAISGNYSPQVMTTPGVAIGDTLNWTEVSGTFTAVGNEAHLAIGDFFTHSQHFILNKYPTNCNGLALYYVDDVSVEIVEVAKAKNDTLIMQGDSVIVGANNSEAAIFNWQPTAGLSCTGCPNPKASPTVTTTYTVTKTQCKAVTSDIITVNVSPTGINELNYEKLIKISPNPANDYLNIEFNEMLSRQLADRYSYSIKISDVLGRDVMITEYKQQVNISSLEKGIYFVSVQQGSKPLVTKKIIKE